MGDHAKGSLHLIPVPIGEVPAVDCIPDAVINQTKKLRYFIAENSKSARRYFKQLEMEQSSITVFEIDKHQPDSNIREFMEPLHQSFDVGLMSEAGIPAVADPGAVFVAEAHRLGLNVVPHSGPSSIILALAASGFNGQNFCFHGYLPKQKDELRQKLQQMEKQSGKFRQAQIFIETPYRNEALFRDLIETLHSDTRLSLSVNITLPAGFSITRSVRQWKLNGPPVLKDQPAVFVMQA